MDTSLANTGKGDASSCARCSGMDSMEELMMSLLLWRKGDAYLVGVIFQLVLAGDCANSCFCVGVSLLLRLDLEWLRWLWGVKNCSVCSVAGVSMFLGCSRMNWGVSWKFTDWKLLLVWKWNHAGAASSSSWSFIFLLLVFVVESSASAAILYIVVGETAIGLHSSLLIVVSVRLWSCSCNNMA